MSLRFRRTLVFRTAARPDSTVWSHYGLFAGLACLGCFLGFFEILGCSQYNFLQNTARMGNETLGDSVSRRINGSAWNWFALQYVAYCLAFDCFTVAKLFVLNRLVEFFRPTFSPTLQRKIEFLDTIFRVAVAVGLLLITCCCGAMAFYATRIAAQDFSYADAFDSGDFKAFSGISAVRVKLFEPLQPSESIMFSCQVVLLLLIVVSFAIAGFFCNRRIRDILSPFEATSSSVEHRQHILEKASHLQKRIVGTAVVVFFAFILRAIFSALFAAGFAQNAANPSPACGICQQCQTLNFLISRWIINTYEFQNIVSCVSPLALSVALWGMTNQRMAKLMSRRSTKSSLSAVSSSTSTSLNVVPSPEQ